MTLIQGALLDLPDRAVMRLAGQPAAQRHMGSATTGAAALSQGKQFVGIEASAHYFKVAIERLGGSAKARAK